MRVTIAGAMESRGGRPSFAARAGDNKGLIELDNSAAAKLAGNAVGEAKLAAIDGARQKIEEAATRLHASGATSPSDGGHWRLLLSALDLD